MAKDIYKIIKNEIQIFEDQFPLQTDARLKMYPFNKDFIKFKRCGLMMVVLYVPTPCVSTNEDRLNVIDKRFAKFRASEAWGICILNTSSLTLISSYFHLFKAIGYEPIPITYNVNQWIKPNGFGKDKDSICDQGIHYFNHWIAAYLYQNRWHEIEFEDSGQICHYSKTCKFRLEKQLARLILDFEQIE